MAGTAAGTVALALLFTAYPKLSWDPWPDAYIFVGTLTAMVAQARGWVEFWFAWLAVDVVGVPLAFNNGLAFSGLVYVIYFVLVVLGLRAWWLQTRTDRTPSGTVPDGATA
ncbi:nicotinamide riboside transporter PnuC [Streptomyces sp. SPB162]|nr:nicotinamide riboside transporter PnuC [Streptomyces sp. SPB162]